MKPLICFGPEEKYYYSDDYEVHQCGADEEVADFLRKIENHFFSKLKIVQINFEALHEALFTSQIALYKIPKASVFIINQFHQKSLTAFDFPINPNTFSEISFEPMVSREDFLKKTNHVIRQIKKGRIYQANLTAPLKARCAASAEEIFQTFNGLFNGPYKALLPMAETQIISFSPELFVRQEHGELITRPIKGSVAKDQNFEDHLLKNKKEEAELSMIVDLLRNDLNSLSENHSAVVKLHRAPLQLGYIQHTFSEVGVQSDWPLSHVILKTAPGGSISGCPKLESLHVISEVEDYKRQAYTGALGWWKENDFGLNITIRSFIKSGDQLYYHAGCGIVADSLPEKEWDEFLMKTGALKIQSR